MTTSLQTMTPATFAPPRILRNPHLQTVWGRIARSRRLVATRRELLDTPDGDELVLDHLDHDGSAARVLLLHGLEGSSNSVYIQGLLSLLDLRGVAATVMNFRSCARDPQRVGTSLPNRGRRLYHSGETSDLGFVVRTLTERSPHQRLLGFGASLGGNVLLKWLGEQGSDSRIVRAATMSVPYDLALGARHLERRAGRPYVRSFVRSLAAKARRVVERHPELTSRIDLKRGEAALTFYDFDDAVTAPLHGFAGADAYYAHSSSIRYLSKIAVPTLCLSARDDPFFPPEALASVAAAASGSVELVITEHGGHAGFVGGSVFHPDYWGERLIVDFLLR